MSYFDYTFYDKNVIKVFVFQKYTTWSTEFDQYRGEVF